LLMELISPGAAKAGKDEHPILIASESGKNLFMPD
jgi:hypothetical protein